MLRSKQQPDRNLSNNCEYKSVGCDLNRPRRTCNDTENIADEQVADEQVAITFSYVSQHAYVNILHKMPQYQCMN